MRSRSAAQTRALARSRREGGEIAAGEPAGPGGPEPLTPEEETLLRRYYEAKILKVCAAFGMPSKVQATAVTLFKRFLLGTSLLQHNAKVIMLTAIYCACKVEENYISAEEFCKGMGQDTDASRVLNAELTLLAGLRFQLVTYSPIEPWTVSPRPRRKLQGRRGGHPQRTTRRVRSGEGGDGQTDVDGRAADARSRKTRPRGVAIGSA